MRLLDVFNEYGQRGGEETVVDNICQLLSSTAPFAVARVRVSSREWQNPGGPGALKQAIRCFSNPGFRSELRRKHLATNAEAWLVHNVFPVASAGVYAEALRLGAPVIQFLHNWRPYSVSGSNFISGRVPSGRLRAHLCREVLAASWRGSRIQTLCLGSILLWLRHGGWLRSVRAWITVSDFARERMVEAGLPRDRVFTLRHFWLPTSKPTAAGKGDHYLFLGRLIPEKGGEVLLDAWNHVRGALGPRTPKIIICGSGPLDQLVARAANHDPVIQFEGEVAGEKKKHLLSTCRAVVIPSLWWEPLGLVAYEAYEHAKPVLAAASGGLTEIVFDGRTGLMHPPADAAKLAQNIISLESDETMRARMGEAGQSWLKKNTDPREWLSAFQRILTAVSACGGDGRS